MGVGSPWSGGRSGKAPKLFSSLLKASRPRGLSPDMYLLTTSDAPEGERVSAGFTVLPGGLRSG